MVNMGVVIAVGLNAATGQREVLGVDVGPSEDGAFWLRFLRGLVARGLHGVQLVISDSHQGLKAAIAAVLQGASLAAAVRRITPTSGFMPTRFPFRTQAALKKSA